MLSAVSAWAKDLEGTPLRFTATLAITLLVSFAILKLSQKEKLGFLKKTY